MKCVFKEMFRFKKELCLIILTVAGTNFCALRLPFFMARLVDHAIPDKSIAHVLKISHIMLLLVVIGVMCGIATSRGKGAEGTRNRADN